MFVYYKGTVYRFLSCRSPDFSPNMWGKIGKTFKIHLSLYCCMFCTTYKTGAKASIHEIKIQ